MAKASKYLQCAARSSSSELLTSPKHQNISFASLLFRAGGSKEPALSADPANNVQISPCCIYSRYTILSSLLSTHGDVRHGMLLHHYIILHQLESSPFLGSHLLHMYFRCKSPENGFALVASMCDLNVYAWNYLMEEYVEHGENQKPLELFVRMQGEAVLPNKITFLIIVKVLAHQPTGLDISKIHAQILNSELGQDKVLGTALMKVYGEGCRMEDATKIFDMMVGKDVVLWTTMINLYAEEDQISEALHLYGKMQQEGSTPTMITYVSLLSMCAKHVALGEGEKIHSQIVADGLNPDIALGNALVNMYGKCACLDDACSVFDKMMERNVVTWTCIITLYAQKGYSKITLGLFDRMQLESVLPNQYTYVGKVVACACTAMPDEGKRAHAQISEGEGVDAVAGAALVNMYDKCGSLEAAEKVFASILARDLVLWNAMISTYAQNGRSKEVMELLESMLAQGLRPDKVTFSNICSLFANSAQKAHGERVHAYIMESGMEPELVVENSLAHMYAHFGDLKQARRIFDNMVDRDVVSWTVMIVAYTACEESEKALQFFDQMQQEGLMPDKVTYITILDSCGSSSSQNHFKRMHARLEKGGFLDLGMEVQNALITLCGKWGNLRDAENIFTTVSERDVVTWNAMVSLYSSLGMADKAIDIFVQMLSEEIRPNKVTFVSVVSSCAGQLLFIEGKLIHTWAVDNSLHTDCILGTAFLNMYGKCGSIEDARNCFDTMPKRNLLTWNAMMAVHSQHGQGKETIELFERMLQERLVPDALSFLAVLVACSHCGFADEGKRLFTTMVQEYGILPSADHCDCLVDLFGRSGRLDEAETFLHSLPSQSRKAPYASVLAACKSKNDADRGERVAKYALESDFDNSGCYVILSNIYSALVKHNSTTTNAIDTFERLMAV
ncbi:hypothetical protein GOP47_0023261 [Adiantum capillus-veneris]|uniref:Pentatricopeptide repeat-containing protein n=1 Tax=Adiantum capillus-veneris TaxID=13818 RepID=A0A9D4Z6S9_ADICA|nr:hypothetical protein GOP47_0023261 [Adiantum capillus-veneris]